MPTLAVALRAAAALLMLHAGPASTRASDAPSVAGRGVTCGSDGHTCPGPHASARDARRRLLLAGWGEATAVRPPQFVELIPAAGGPGSGDAAPHRRVFAHQGCADSPEWRFMWPTSLTEGFTCEDYATGAINHAYCDDLGYEFDAGEWLTARQACPVACAACCDIAPHCAQEVSPAACRQTCKNDRTITVGGQSVVLTDAFEKYLAHIDENTAHVTMDAGLWAMYRQHSSGVDTVMTANQTVHQVVPFLGGQFTDEKEFRFFSSTPLSRVRYTTDGTVPSPTHGTVASKAKLVRSAQFKAISYMPPDTQISLPESNATSVPITIKASTPILTVLECATGEGIALRFNATFEYSSQACLWAKVEIRARTSLGSLGNETRLRYVVNQPDPGASNPQGLYRAVITLTSTAADDAEGNQTGSGGGISVSGSTQLSARAWRLGTLPSDVVMSPAILLGMGAVKALGWMGTAGHWKLTRAHLTGVYQRPLSRNGGCNERLGTLISPSSIRDAAELLGAAELRGPACKGGVWDLDHALSPILTWFIEANGEDDLGADAAMGASMEPGAVGPTVDWLGVRFDSLNTGLYAVDDISAAVAAGNFPVETLSVEAALSINTDVRIALGGLVAARIDGVEVGGFRYGKGWSLAYSVDVFADTVTFIFTLAVTAAEIQPGVGGLHDVKAEVPRRRLPPRQLFHLVCKYDGKHASIFLDGARLVHHPMCQHERCGSIMYPKDEDVLYTGGRPVGVTLGVLDSLEKGQTASHEGTLRMVRIFNKALSNVQIKAASDRMHLWRLAEIACPPGQYGPYEGLEPCVPCAPGTISVNFQSDVCEDCARDFYAPAEGGVECFLCEAGLETLGAGSASCTNDGCLLGRHDCDALASCISTNATSQGFTCVCLPGFHGSGKVNDCQTLCGDGIIAGAEECDDGNSHVGDGCSDSCSVESHFECSLTGTRSTCACVGPPEACCVVDYGLCLRGLQSSVPNAASTPPTTGAAACLARFVDCQTAAAQEADKLLPAPDVPLFRSGNSTTYGLSRDQDPELVSLVPAACDPDQLRKCQMLQEQCAIARTGIQRCLELEAACLMAVECR